MRPTLFPAFDSNNPSSYGLDFFYPLATPFYRAPGLRTAPSKLRDDGFAVIPPKVKTAPAPLMKTVLDVLFWRNPSFPETRFRVFNILSPFFLDYVIFPPTKAKADLHPPPTQVGLFPSSGTSGQSCSPSNFSSPLAIASLSFRRLHPFHSDALPPQTAPQNLLNHRPVLLFHHILTPQAPMNAFKETAFPSPPWPAAGPP